MAFKYSLFVFMFAVSALRFEVQLSGAELITEAQVAQAAKYVSRVGFAVLRNGSLFSDQALNEAMAAGENLTYKLVLPTLAEKRLTLPRPPWTEQTIDLKEVRSYHPGRLDLQRLLDEPPFTSKPWRSTAMLQKLCAAALQETRRRATEQHQVPGFAVEDGCDQKMLGMLWNFRTSDEGHWHRDGRLPLLTFVIAAEEYPQAAGFMKMLAKTHYAGKYRHIEGVDEAGSKEAPIEVPLRKGDILMFHYSLLHASLPNRAFVDRGLIYTVYGPPGVKDDSNVRDDFPSLLDSTPFNEL
eukprot:TRINITY_DN57486_c0_g1_i1.p1 TRINITY_DN57486_c0_g1~~TRINITY_DN57486_c0_g1_i1.p1  ORF type:complete len:297 (-),score=45.91 TRINITY_DN57486_c0_g1_i1:268-1158(-)